jgi:hypothetical protein
VVVVEWARALLQALGRLAIPVREQPGGGLRVAQVHLGHRGAHWQQHRGDFARVYRLATHRPHLDAQKLEGQHTRLPHTIMANG